MESAENLAPGPPGGFLLTKAEDELGSPLGLLPSIISGAGAALALCSRPHAALHHLRAALPLPEAGSLTCEKDTSVMAYINTALSLISSTDFFFSCALRKIGM